MTREEAINILYGIQADNLNLNDAYTKDKYEALDIAIKALEQEPKTGYWIDIDDIESECSECGHREPNERFIFKDINFCAKCGARMVEP